jgi:excisionase family DNA binding protein
MVNDEMLTPIEVSDFLKVPVETIWRWCRNETLPAVKIGKYWRIPKDRLDAFVDPKGNKTLAQGESARE